MGTGEAYVICPSEDCVRATTVKLSNIKPRSVPLDAVNLMEEQLASMVSKTKEGLAHKHNTVDETDASNEPYDIIHLETQQKVSKLASASLLLASASDGDTKKDICNCKLTDNIKLAAKDTKDSAGSGLKLKSSPANSNSPVTTPTGSDQELFQHKAVEDWMEKHADLLGESSCLQPKARLSTLLTVLTRPSVVGPL